MAYDTIDQDVLTNGPNLSSIWKFYNTSLSQSQLLLHGLEGWDGIDGQPSTTGGVIHLAGVASGLILEAGMAAQNISDGINEFTQNVTELYNPTLQDSIPVVINTTIAVQNQSNLAVSNVWLNSNILASRLNWYITRINEMAGNTSEDGAEQLKAFASYLSNVLQAEEMLQITNNSYNILKANVTVNAMTDTPMANLTEAIANYTDLSNLSMTDATKLLLSDLGSVASNQNDLLQNHLESEANSELTKGYLAIQDRAARIAIPLSNAAFEANTTVNAAMNELNAALGNLTSTENGALANLQSGANFSMGLINETLSHVSDVTDSADSWRFTAEMTTGSLVDSIAQSKQSLLKQVRSGMQTAGSSVLSNVLNLAKSSDAIKQSLQSDAADLNEQMTAIASELADNLGMSVADFSNLAGNISNIVGDIQRKFGDKVKQKMAASDDDMAAITAGMKEKLQSSALNLASAVSQQNQLSKQAFSSTASAGISMLQDYHKQIVDGRAAVAAYQNSVARSGGAADYAGMASEATDSGSAIASRLQSAINNQRQAQLSLAQGQQLASQAQTSVANSTASVAEDLQQSIDDYVNAFPERLQPQLDAIQDDTAIKVGSYLNSSISKAQAMQVQLSASVLSLKNQQRIMDTAVGKASSNFYDSSSAFDNAVNASDTSIAATISNLNSSAYSLESSANASLANTMVNHLSSNTKKLKNFRDSAYQQIAGRATQTNPIIKDFVDHVNGANSDSSGYEAQYAKDSALINSSIADGENTVAALTTALTAILPEALLTLPVQFIKDNQQMSDTLNEWNTSALQNITDSTNWYSNATSGFGLALQAQAREAAALQFATPVTLATLVEAIQANLSAPIIRPSSATMNMTDAIVQGMLQLAGNLTVASDVMMTNISTAFAQQQQRLYNSTTLSDLSDTLDELDQLTGDTSSNASFVDSILRSVGGVAASLMRTSADVTSQAVQSVRNQLSMTTGNSALVAKLEAATSQSNLNLLSSAALQAAANLKDHKAALQQAKQVARDNAVDMINQISAAKGAQAQLVSAAFQAVSSAQANASTTSVIDETPLIASTAQQTIGLWNAYAPDSIARTETFLADQAVALNVADTLIQTRLNMSNTEVNIGISHLSGVAQELVSLQSDIDRLANATQNNQDSVSIESTTLQQAAADIKEELINSLDQQVEVARAQAEAEAESASQYISSLVTNLTESVNAVPVSLGLVEA